MARLDGPKSSSTPIILAVLVVAALALGAYYFSTKSHQNEAPADNSMATPLTSDSTPPATDSNATDANSTDSSTNATPDAAATPDSNAATTPTADSTPAADATSGETPASTPEVTPGADATPDSTTAASTPASSGKNDVIAKRSKTIVSKDGSSVTYSKEVHRDGGVTQNKTTGSSPAKP